MGVLPRRHAVSRLAPQNEKTCFETEHKRSFGWNQNSTLKQVNTKADSNSVLKFGKIEGVSCNSRAQLDL